MREMLIEGFAERGLQLTISPPAANMPVAKCVRFTKRARMGYKIEFNFSFRSEKRMFEHCADYLKSLARAEEFKAERKAKRAAERAESVANVKEGDIYVASWGWEQTNVDAYQVVAKKGATVTLREIALCSVEGSEQFMADRVKPVKNEFIGAEFKKRITGRSINISSCETASPMGDREDFYRSWYA